MGNGFFKSSTISSSPSALVRLKCAISTFSSWPPSPLARDIFFVAVCAFVVRLLVVVAILVVSGYVLPNVTHHNTSTIHERSHDVMDTATDKEGLDFRRSVHRGLKGFRSWDGEYFVNFATRVPPYTVEHQHAFFPFYPAAVRAAVNFWFANGNNTAGYRLPGGDAFLDKDDYDAAERLSEGPLSSPSSTSPSQFSSSAVDRATFMAAAISNISSVVATAALFMFFQNLSLHTAASERKFRGTNPNDANIAGREDNSDRMVTGGMLTSNTPQGGNANDCDTGTSPTWRSGGIAQGEGEGEVAALAALLFSINGASVFMSSAYTESLFAMLTSLGILLLDANERRDQDDDNDDDDEHDGHHDGGDRVARISPPVPVAIKSTARASRIFLDALHYLRLILAVIFLSLATATRSNGILSLLPLVFASLRQCPLTRQLLLLPTQQQRQRQLPSTGQHPSADTTTSSSSSLSSASSSLLVLRKPSRLYRVVFTAVLHWFLVAVLCISVAFPLWATMGYAYAAFCDELPTDHATRIDDPHHHHHHHHYRRHAIDKLQQPNHDVIDVVQSSLQTGFLFIGQVLRRVSRTFLFRFLAPNVVDSLVEAPVVQSGAPAWCQSLVPSVYAHIQRNIWNVRPFGYWKLCKIDRFAVAMPYYFVAISAFGSRVLGAYRRTSCHEHHVHDDRDPHRCIIHHSVKQPPSEGATARAVPNDGTRFNQMEASSSSSSSSSSSLSPFRRAISNLPSLPLASIARQVILDVEFGHALQLAVLACSVLFIANAEIFVRLAMGTPYLYLHVARMLSSLSCRKVDHDDRRQRRRRRPGGRGAVDRLRNGKEERERGVGVSRVGLSEENRREDGGEGRRHANVRQRRGEQNRDDDGLVDRHDTTDSCVGDTDELGDGEDKVCSSWCLWTPPLLSVKGLCRWYLFNSTFCLVAGIAFFPKFITWT